MAEPPVINASPLIFLSRGSFLDLLQLLDEKVFVPSAVAVEIQQRGDRLTAQLRRRVGVASRREAACR
ncbi:hypothetical protein [Nostoc sp.]|uniref:hypothetical protein n=1 Tax=Nostoc sp. TaxID=1180 RepID=UPI002FF58D34